MRIKVLVTLDVEESEQGMEIPADDKQDAAVEAVQNALRHAEGEGFSHGLEEKVAVTFVDAVLYDEDATDELPFNGSHAPDCPHHVGGECLCWRNDPEQNPELDDE